MRDRKYLKMLSEYLKAYGDNYPEDMLQYIEEEFMKERPLCESSDVLRQIYAKLGMLEPSKNCYLGFAKLIGERYGWDYHILEIGAGFFPAFSYYIDDMHAKNKSSGTITAYDPYLVVNKLGNVKLHKEAFKETMDVSKCDLLVGIMPCDATKLIIKKAIEGQKEFFIAMCGCPPEESFNPYFGYPLFAYEKFVDEVYTLAMQQEEDGFKVIVEDAKQYSFPYPVFSSKRR